MSEARVHDVVVVGASAGGVEALRNMAAQLPGDLPAAVLVVLHVTAAGPSALPEILRRAGRLPVAHGVDGDELLPGRVLVAPPDNQMIVADGRLRVSRAPKENGHRPAIDPLFRSAAAAHGPRVVGVILSGMLDDGAAGLAAVKAAGGVAIVQDPDDASYPSMPRSALGVVDADEIVSSRLLGGAIARWVATAPGSVRPAPRWLQQENGYATDPHAGRGGEAPPGEPSGQTCPTCGGALWVLSDAEGPLRYRCRVGHAWSAESLFADNAAGLEDALWTALRALQERAGLARRLGDDARARRRTLAAEHFERSAEDADRRAAIVRQALEQAYAGEPDTLDRAPESLP
ncbi:MAG TPA: chemotaxis protein CheB [Miltoncostaea sp.]|nr:chemotaxis protein CheB [Miltoncostaea sp.]